jgi:hypothetical protein
VGVALDVHDRLPDLIVHDRRAHRLVLVEAVTSHGPIDAQRHRELAARYGQATAPLAFVTAILNHRTLARYAGEIDRTTAAWVADTPDRVVHFESAHFPGTS